MFLQPDRDQASLNFGLVLRQQWGQPMQLSAVFLARAVFFVEAIDLNPRGGMYYPKLVHALVERYGFQKFPQKPEEFDESKGVTFEQGLIGGITIERVVIYNNGLQLDTQTDTRASEEILIDALGWASETLGLVYSPEMVKKRAYVSQFTFYSDVPLLQMHPALANLSSRVSRSVSESLKLPTNFQASGFQITQDPASQVLPVSPFTIERRAQTPFSENKYFTAAPLPTPMHFDLIEEYEAMLKSA
jgi:hypothetical protein